jgi:hypothetical protein
VEFEFEIAVKTHPVTLHASAIILAMFGACSVARIKWMMYIMALGSHKTTIAVRYAAHRIVLR